MTAPEGLPAPRLDNPAAPRPAKVVGVVALMVALLVVAAIIDARSGSEDPAEQSAGATTTSTVTSSPATTVTSRPAARAGWPSELTGRPALLGPPEQIPSQLSDAQPGIYIWSDFTGWHLWVVNGDAVQGLSGTITSNAAMGDPTLQEPFVGSAVLDDRVTTFELPADVAAAGLRFNPGFFSNTVTIDARPLTGELLPEPVLLGAKLAPRSLPLVLEKTTR